MSDIYRAACSTIKINRVIGRRLWQPVQGSIIIDVNEDVRSAIGNAEEQVEDIVEEAKKSKIGDTLVSVAIKLYMPHFDFRTSPSSLPKRSIGISNAASKTNSISSSDRQTAPSSLLFATHSRLEQSHFLNTHHDSLVVVGMSKAAPVVAMFAVVDKTRRSRPRDSYYHADKAASVTMRENCDNEALSHRAPPAAASVDLKRRRRLSRAFFAACNTMTIQHDDTQISSAVARSSAGRGPILALFAQHQSLPVRRASRRRPALGVRASERVRRWVCGQRETRISGSVIVTSEQWQLAVAGFMSFSMSAYQFYQSIGVE